ncbi:hypothetical protein BpHYR1_000594 [Brachionus plicatilis]|uniref:Uncharacterized protein n=1 Tax=Brachionus plicatilis TaxID=10195 RepID=A0A3M7R5U2_BRAPC|nr:hypothetical protein BpHYR1_000594 [Brachionus plicatilis]
MENNKNAKDFKSAIRLYNSILSFTSVGCKLDESLLSANKGTYTFRMSGGLHHSISHYMPPNGQIPKFSQIYIFDQQLQTQLRNNMFSDNKRIKLDDKLIEELQNYLHKVNPYVDIYQQVGKKLQANPHEQINIILKNNYTKDKRYNTPTTDEIAVLMINNNQDQQNAKRDITIFPKSGGLKYINEIHSSYDPLHYVLMFMKGEQGWQPNTIPINSTKDFTENIETQKKNELENSNNSENNNSAINTHI